MVVISFPIKESINREINWPFQVISLQCNVSF